MRAATGARRTARAGRVTTAIALLVAALSGTACDGGDDAGPVPATGDPARGAAAFAGMCAQCHGLEAQGIPGMGMDLRGSVFVRRSTLAEIARFVRDGHAPTAAFPGGMPEDGGDPSLTPRQLADIGAWLKSLPPTSRAGASAGAR